MEKPINDVPSLVRNLNIFIDEESIIRCKGRLENCEYLSFDMQNPMLLPKSSYLRELIIWNAYVSCKHMGSASTLNDIRKNGLWIPQGRLTVKGVLKRCIICQKINAYSFRYPKPNNLISDRVNLIKPFKHTGIDFTGHFQVKFGEKVAKMYLLVFTCLNVRAIHLELLPSMSCEHFLQAFIRFCNLHTIPSAIYSDNASTFIQAMGLISNSFSNNEFSEYLEKNNIKHVRIPLYAAWIGSFWERMIRTIKSSLYKVVGRKQLEYFYFVSLLSDIQNSINARPLTYRDDDSSFLPLTLNCFIKSETGKDFILDNLAGSQLDIPNRNKLIESIEKRQDIYNNFKEHWYNNYLLSLKESSRDVYQGTWEDKVAVDDVVFISSPIKNRRQWQMGRVIQMLTGKNQITRCVKVVRPYCSEGVYAISHLYP